MTAGLSDGFGRVVYPDGSVVARDLVDGYRKWDPAGTLLTQRALTSRERARLTPDDLARDLATVDLEALARQAVATDDAYLARPTPAFPLTVAAQQILYEQTLALTRQVKTLIRLVVANDMLD